MPAGPLTNVPLRPVPAVTSEVVALLPLSIKPPAAPPMERPPVKVLAPESRRMPLPVLVILPAVWPRKATEVAEAMAVLALPPRVTVVPTMAVTDCPSKVEPTTRLPGTLATVTVGLAKVLLVTETEPAVLAPLMMEEMVRPEVIPL